MIYLWSLMMPSELKVEIVGVKILEKASILGLTVEF